jgi:hypothetical protein
VLIHGLIEGDLFRGLRHSEIEIPKDDLLFADKSSNNRRAFGQKIVMWEEHRT